MGHDMTINIIGIGKVEAVEISTSCQALKF